MKDTGIQKTVYNMYHATSATIATAALRASGEAEENVSAAATTKYRADIEVTVDKEDWN